MGQKVSHHNLTIYLNNLYSIIIILLVLVEMYYYLNLYIIKILLLINIWVVIFFYNDFRLNRLSIFISYIPIILT